MKKWKLVAVGFLLLMLILIFLRYNQQCRKLENLGYAAGYVAGETDAYLNQNCLPEEAFKEVIGVYKRLRELKGVGSDVEIFEGEFFKSGFMKGYKDGWDSVVGQKE